MILINQNILWLKISVYDSSGMTEIQGGYNLVQVFLEIKRVYFDLQRCEVELILIEVLLEVEVEVLEDQTEFLVLGEVDDIPETEIRGNITRRCWGV